ncbi:MAG: hypothetical protein KDA91_08650 [Planctomycetaceae bacterium]|nr:hypothetical protein [Planctomycetaceae bacterium]
MEQAHEKSGIPAALDQRLYVIFLIAVMRYSIEMIRRLELSPLLEVLVHLPRQERLQLVQVQLELRPVR